MIEDRDRISIFYTVLVALFLSVQAINTTITSLVTALAGSLMTPLYGLFGLMIFANVGTVMFPRARMYTRYAGAFFIVIIYYIATRLVAPYSDLSFGKFISMTVLAVLCFSIKRVEPRLLLKIMMLAPCIGIFWVGRIFAVGGKDEIVTMGVSYAFMSSVISTIIYLFWYLSDEKERKGKWLFIIASVINIIYALRIIMYGSRGPVLCILVCLFFCICFDYKNGVGIRLRSWKLIILAIALLFVGFNIWTVLDYVSSFLRNYGLKINTINKLYRLVGTGNDVSNGRTYIWRTVLDEIPKSPIWGHGLSTTLNNLNFPYPHNFLLQSLYDGGIILTIIVFVPFFIGLVRFFVKCKSKDIFCMGLALFCMSVPGALLSSDLWENGRLWVAIGFFIMWSISDYSNRYIKIVEQYRNAVGISEE